MMMLLHYGRCRIQCFQSLKWQIFHSLQLIYKKDLYILIRNCGHNEYRPSDHVYMYTIFRSLTGSRVFKYSSYTLTHVITLPL